MVLITGVCVVAATGKLVSIALAVVIKVLAVVAATVGLRELVCCWIVTGFCVVVATEPSTLLTVELTIALAVVVDINSLAKSTCHLTEILCVPD